MRQIIENDNISFILIVKTCFVSIMICCERRLLTFIREIKENKLFYIDKYDYYRCVTNSYNIEFEKATKCFTKTIDLVDQM